MSLLRKVKLFNILRKNICSSSILWDFKYKAMDLYDLRHQVLEDPNAGKEATNIGIPDTMGEALGKRRYELICQLYGEDAFDEKLRKLNRNSTKENPNLVATDESHRKTGCICDPEQTGIFWHHLYKDHPTRCSCGHWFQLVSYEDYYKRINSKRENRYNQVASTPEIKELESDLEKFQSEFNEFLGASRNMTIHSDGAFEMMDKMSNKWKNIISTRKRIEAILDGEDNY